MNFPRNLGVEKAKVRFSPVGKLSPVTFPEGSIAVTKTQAAMTGKEILSDN
jgi:hypothetical protein